MKYFNYTREHSDFTQWQWSDQKMLLLVSRVQILQVRLLGKLLTLGFDLNIDVGNLEIVTTSEIEDETLNNEQVRSSVTRHLGLGVDDTIMSTATYRYKQQLLLNGLLGWYNAIDELAQYSIIVKPT